MMDNGAGMRSAQPGELVQGVSPNEVLEPATTQDASDVLGMLRVRKLSCVFAGGGTQLGLGEKPQAPFALVRTGRMARIVEYTPSDQVVTVQPGVPLATLQATLAKERQRLSLDPPFPQRSTIGGIIAANAFGPLRARAGAIRDLILGVTLVRADGVVAKGGGKVVKNVAGFDLPKLACGSLGTLGLIAQATLRVHPLPETEDVRIARGLPTDGVPALVDAIRAAQLEPAALLAVRESPGKWDVALRFEGFAAGVTQQVARLGTLAIVEASGPAPFAAHQAARESAGLRLKFAALPTALPQVEEALTPLSQLLPRAEVAWYPTLGLGFFSAPAAAKVDVDIAGKLVSAVAAARYALQQLRGSVTLEVVPEGLRGQLPAWSSPTSLQLHQAVKARFDPDGLLAPGRFVGGI